MRIWSSESQWASYAFETVYPFYGFTIVSLHAHAITIPWMEPLSFFFPFLGNSKSYADEINSQSAVWRPQASQHDVGIPWRPRNVSLAVQSSTLILLLAGVSCFLPSRRRSQLEYKWNAKLRVLWAASTKITEETPSLILTYSSLDYSSARWWGATKYYYTVGMDRKLPALPSPHWLLHWEVCVSNRCKCDHGKKKTKRRKIAHIHPSLAWRQGFVHIQRKE